jgi:hypothetical protein
MSGLCFGLQESIFLFWNDAKYSFISICFFQLGSGVYGHLNPDQVLHVWMPKENNVHCTCWLLLMHDEKLPGMITSTLQSWIDYGHSFRFQYIDHRFLNPPKILANPNLSPKFFFSPYTGVLHSFLWCFNSAKCVSVNGWWWSSILKYTESAHWSSCANYFVNVVYATADSFNRWRCN